MGKEGNKINANITVVTLIDGSIMPLAICGTRRDDETAMSLLRESSQLIEEDLGSEGGKATPSENGRSCYTAELRIFSAYVYPKF